MGEPFGFNASRMIAAVQQAHANPDDLGAMLFAWEERLSEVNQVVQVGGVACGNAAVGGSSCFHLIRARSLARKWRKHQFRVVND